MKIILIIDVSSALSSSVFGLVFWLCAHSAHVMLRDVSRSRAYCHMFWAHVRMQKSVSAPLFP